MPPSDPTTTRSDGDLESVAHLRVAVARLGRLLRQQAGDSLSPTLQSALVTIDQRGPLSLGDLGAAEQIAPATVTKIVGRLTDDALVRRSSDPLDGRVTLVSLTSAGARRLASSRQRRTAWLAERLAVEDAPSAQDLQTAVEVLEWLVEPRAEIR
ncbi:MAG TPA: MarR family transcriptional regulator [Acidimicrobiales bacterium]|nr:MarR family transcriptional regulator [Acidimicrobiales bacterium]